MYNNYGFRCGRIARNIDKINKLEKEIKKIQQNSNLSDEDRKDRIKDITVRILYRENAINFIW